jgi:putative ABC transport system substrate-binding protein
LREIQPNLRRLGAFWISPEPAIQDYFETLKFAAKAHGVELKADVLTREEELPSRLRSMVGQVDALWLPPDPMLITPSSFSIIKEFSLSNNIPLYVPLDSLVDKGATASIASRFREIGRTVGLTAARVVAGRASHDENIYSDKYFMVLNLTSAKQTGLDIPAEVVKRADRVVP